MKVIIYEPKIDEKWGFKLGGRAGKRTRKTVNTLLSAIERSLPRLVVNQKVSVKVKYSDNSINESLDSNNFGYLMYTLSCFLEDHLTKRVLNKYLKYNRR